MARLELPYVQVFKDRHGRLRHYLRKKGRPRAPLPGLPGSDEFMAAYAAGLGEHKRVGTDRTRAGTLSALIVAFYQSAEFKILGASTRSTYRNMLERLRTKAGDVPMAQIDRVAIQRWIDAKADTPEAANNLLKRLRKVLDFAVDRGFIRTNPAKTIKRIRTRSDGHVAWSDADIVAFNMRWPSGSRERLAATLLLYTGQRRSDVVGMGRQRAREGRIHVRQLKTGARVAIPLHPYLAAELALIPADQLTYLVTGHREPFTAAGFGNWFGAAARAAGLEGRTAHGLRKAAGRCLAEAGCSAHQIMAILGHKTLTEAERYTRSAAQERLADDAMAAWSGAGAGTKAVKPSAVSVKPTRKAL